MSEAAARMARGMRTKPGGPLRIVISMDEDTFNEVRSRALRAKLSFAEQARLLIEWGLEAEDYSPG